MPPRHYMTAVLLPNDVQNSTNSQNSKKYATIGIPDSYQTAVDALLKAFKLYKSPYTTSKDDVELLTISYVNDINGLNTVWSVLDADNWGLVMAGEVIANSMLGLRELIQTNEELPDEKPFVIGYNGLSYGTIANGVTTWTSISGMGRTCSPRICRPKSYDEAVEFVKAACAFARTTNDNARYTIGRLEMGTQEYKFKFYTFFKKDKDGKVVTDFWYDIPERAQHDDAVWRQFAPDPSNDEALGFTLHKLPISEKSSND